MQSQILIPRTPAISLRVVFRSTYPPMRCAIGIYTQQLAEALVSGGAARPFVAAEDDGSGADPGSAVEVRRVYRRDEDYRERIFDAVMGAGCNLVHLQYAPDLFGEDERLPSLVARFAQAGVRPLVTLHTVYGARVWRRLVRRPTTRRFHRALA